MTDARPAVDVEALLVAYLAQAPEISITLGETIAPERVATDLPEGWPAPDPAFVRLTRIGGSTDPRDPVDHLEAARIQIDAFAVDSPAAFALLGLALVAVQRLPSAPWDYPGAVVTAARTSLRPRRRDDQATDVPSYFAEVVLSVHAVAV